MLVVKLFDHPVDVACDTLEIVTHEFEDGVKESLLFFFGKAGVSCFAEIGEVRDTEAFAGQDFRPESVIFLPEIKESFNVALLCLFDAVADEAGTFLRIGKLSDGVRSCAGGCGRTGSALQE